MSDTATPSKVDSKEDLYRCITTPDWWVAEEKRPSSAAFKQPVFSTDVASRAGSIDHTLRRFSAACGLVCFNYADAKTIGFIARLEEDPEHPDNKAHANVYNPNATSKRKTMAAKLIQKIVERGGIFVEPTFVS